MGDLRRVGTAAGHVPEAACCQWLECQADGGWGQAGGELSDVIADSMITMMNDGVLFRYIHLVRNLCPA